MPLSSLEASSVERDGESWQWRSPFNCMDEYRLLIRLAWPLRDGQGCDRVASLSQGSCSFGIAHVHPLHI